MERHINLSNTNKEIDLWIDHLASTNLKERKTARERLVMIGKPAVPALIHLLTDPRADQRWEAACVLGDIADPEAAPALVTALEDDTVQVRWRAAEALTQMGRESLLPLFRQLENRSDCVQLREGAHHILHCLNDDGVLDGPSLKVMEALESPDPAVAVPWAAEKAIDALAAEKKAAHPAGQEIDAEMIFHHDEDNPFLDRE